MDPNDVRSALEEKLRMADGPWERLPILIELASIPANNNHDRAWVCAQEALTIARGLNDRFWIARGLQATGRRLMMKARYSEALHHLRQASSMFGRVNEPLLKTQTDHRIAMILIFMGKFNEAMKLLGELLAAFGSLNDPKGELHTIQYMGHVHKSIGDHAKAIEHYRTALEMAHEHSPGLAVGYLYADLAFVYRNLGDDRRRQAYLFRALTAMKKAGHREGMAVTTANIAAMYLERHLYDRAEKYVRWSGMLSRQLGMIAEEAMAWGQLGEIAGHSGDFARARLYYYKGLKMVRESEHKVFRAKLLEFFGVVCREAGRPQEGIRFMKKGLRIMSASGYALYESDIHENLVPAYEALGNTKKALHHHKEFTRLREEYSNSLKALEAGRAEMRERIRKLETDLRNEQAANTSLQRIIEKKEEELVALTLQLVQEGNGRKSGGKGAQQRIAETWETFARQFHKVHHNFYANLIKRYPQLTPAEIKVCSLIRIGLSSKEIAAILGVSKRTVDSHREHIHKKLNVTTRLTSFIASMRDEL